MTDLRVQWCRNQQLEFVAYLSLGHTLDHDLKLWASDALMEEIMIDEILEREKFNAKEKTNQ